jgi:hypothetical protein
VPGEFQVVGASSEKRVGVTTDAVHEPTKSRLEQRRFVGVVRHTAFFEARQMNALGFIRAK